MNTPQDNALPIKQTAGNVIDLSQNKWGNTHVNALPDYLTKHYYWAYLNPKNVKWLDQEWLVNLILWGQARRLRYRVLEQIKTGDHVLQAAHVYGKLIPELAQKVGQEGKLDIFDVAQVQVDLCQKKIANFSQASVALANAESVNGQLVDVVNCFFLLHEVPDNVKVEIIDNLLSCLVSGGKAIFVDYHGPIGWHPLRRVMLSIFRYFEPFAYALWEKDVLEFSQYKNDFNWSKKTFFGGLYQMVIAVKK